MRANPGHAPLRVDGYIRVSKVGTRRGPRFISPSVQREAIEAWVARGEFELLDVFEELDESGLRRDRPLLELAIRRIEGGASSGLVVWRVDRFGRSLSDGLQIIERVRAVGGHFYSVHDGLDIDTDAGRLALRILLSVAEFQADGIRASWKAAREHAIRRGVHLGGQTPVGYRKMRSGRLRPDPVVGPIVAEMYRRRAAGETLLTLARFLEAEGVITGAGNRGWSPTTISALLRKPVYLGHVHDGINTNLRAHAALVDAATWEAVQRLHRVPVRTVKPLFLIGVARCASCRYALHAANVRPANRDAKYLNYCCNRFHAPGACPAPVTISALKLEPYVRAKLLSILAHRRHDPVDRLAEAEQGAHEAEEALDRYRDNDRIAAVIGEKKFLEGLATRQSRVSDARLDVIDARARHQLHMLPAASDVRDGWHTMTVPEQRALTRNVIDAVFVARGRGPAADRVTISPAGTGPRRLPRPGKRGARALPPIQPRRGWINPQTRPVGPPSG